MKYKIGDKVIVSDTYFDRFVGTIIWCVPYAEDTDFCVYVSAGFQTNRNGSTELLDRYPVRGFEIFPLTPLDEVLD